MECQLPCEREQFHPEVTPGAEHLAAGLLYRHIHPSLPDTFAPSLTHGNSGVNGYCVSGVTRQY